MYRFDEIKDRLTEMARVRKKVVAVAAAGDKVVLETIKIMNEHGFGRGCLSFYFQSLGFGSFWLPLSKIVTGLF